VKYTWECQGCKQIAVVDRPAADIDRGPEEACPLCNNSEYKRILTASGGFILSGNGWYKKGGY